MRGAIEYIEWKGALDSQPPHLPELRPVPCETTWQAGRCLFFCYIKQLARPRSSHIPKEARVVFVTRRIS